MTKRLSILLAVAATLLLLLPACDDDDCPTCPGDNPAPTMQNIWPHADGNAWTYDAWWVRYEAEGPATDLPTMAELYADLTAAPVGAPSDTVAGLLRVELDGTYTTLTDVETQHRRETWFLEPEYDDPAKRQQEMDSVSGRLTGLIAAARPDLRDAIGERFGPPAKDYRYLSGPVLFGGRAYAYEDTGYYCYGDLDQNHSWVYLESDLEIGAEFSFQLIPALTDDVWLHARIWSIGDLTVGGQEFQNVVECMYVIDLGEAERTDESGTGTETVRSYEYGTVHYVPGVGPVRVRERGLVATSTPFGDHEDVFMVFDVDLVGAVIAD